MPHIHTHTHTAPPSLTLPDQQCTQDTMGTMESQWHPGHTAAHLAGRWRAQVCGSRGCVGMSIYTIPSPSLGQCCTTWASTSSRPGRAAGASCIPGRGGRCWVTPPRGWQAAKGGSQSPCAAAAAAAVASFLQLMLFWAKLEASSSWEGELEPAAPPAAVRSPRRRWSTAPRAQAAGRHARPRARTRPQTPRTPWAAMPACPGHEETAWAPSRSLF